MKFSKITLIIFIFAYLVSMFKDKPSDKNKYTSYNSSSKVILKMPEYDVIDITEGEILVSIAAQYKNNDDHNIIYAASCWANHSGPKNIFIYFVNDPTYRLKNKRQDEHKVIALYKKFNGDSYLWFFNADGSIRRQLKI